MQSWTTVSAAAVLLSACVTSTPSAEDDSAPSTEEGSATINAPAVKPAEIKPDECLSYTQLKADAEYLCELADGSTRALLPGERRTLPLSREEIDQVFGRNREDTESCILSVLGTDSKSEGKIYVKFEIGLDGKVTSSTYVADRSTFKNEKLGKCFAEKIKAWRFPILPGEDTLEITYPFAFMKAEPFPESSAPEKKD